MQPCRVLVETSSGSKKVYTASLCKDKVTHERRVFVFERINPKAGVDQNLLPDEEITHATAKALAHKMVSKRNSMIAGQYHIARCVPDDNKYSLYRVVDNGTSMIPIGDEEYTQQDCLLTAMTNFCIINGYAIKELL